MIMQEVMGIDVQGKKGEEGRKGVGLTLTFKALCGIASASLLQSESSNSSAPSNKNCPLEKKQNNL